MHTVDFAIIGYGAIGSIIGSPSDMAAIADALLAGATVTLDKQRLAKRSGETVTFCGEGTRPPITKPLRVWG
jgi:hypothetical protein